MKNLKAFAPLLLAVFTDLIGFGIALPVLPGLFLDVNGILPVGTPYATRTIILGFILGLFPLIQIFSAPILGALADRHGRKPVLLLSFAGTLVGYLMFAIGIVTSQLWLLVLGRAIDGATGGNISVATAAIADLSTEKTRTKNFGLIGMAFGLGFVIGPYLGGKLSDPAIVSWFSFATPFWFAAILSVVNIALLAFFFSETLKKKRSSPVTLTTGIDNIRLAFTMPRVRLLFLVQFLLTLGVTFYTSYFQVYLIDRFHISQGAIGDAFGFIGICIALSQGILARPIADRFSPAAVLRVATVGLAATLALILVPSQMKTLFFIFPFLAVFQGLVSTNITTIISASAGKESQGEILGLNQSVASFAQFLPGLIGGVAAAYSPTAPMLLGAALMLAAWAAFVVGYREGDAEIFHEA